MRDIPVIDLQPLLRGDADGLAQVAGEIGAACRRVGFFYVVNHGVSADQIEAAFAQSRAFFAQSVDQKLEVSMDVVGGNRGYSGFMREALDPAHGLDKKEAFNIGVELAADDAGLIAGEPFRALNGWPALTGFRAALLDYFNACLKLGGELHR